MKILHPNIKKHIELDMFPAEYKDESVYKIISNELKPKLEYFLKSFEEYRENRKERMKNLNLYKNLPFSINDKSWRSKRKDVRIIKNLIKTRKNLNILDVGAWNGWLSNCLCADGHTVVATDIFTDEFDGLKAQKYYNNDFITLQILPSELWRIQAKFDLIIFNRNWAYLENQFEVFESSKSLLHSNGIIIMTGLTFYKKPSLIKKNIEAMDNFFRDKYGISILFFDTKGYLDNNDEKFLKNLQLKVLPYNKTKNFFRKISRYPLHKYCLYEKK